MALLHNDSSVSQDAPPPSKPEASLLTRQQTMEFLHHCDCETPEDGCTAIRPLRFKVGSCQEISIATSLHGMVCVLLTNPVDIILRNPMTGGYKTLSKAGSHKDCYKYYKARYGLYYTSSEDDYKLVCLTENPINVYIYSLKSDSWRKVEIPDWSLDLNDYTYLCVSMRGSVLLNEKLYFGNSYSVMMFDTEAEKLRVIETPRVENQRTCCFGLMVVGDCIHFCMALVDSYGRADWIGQWRMDGDGDWTKVETCSLEENLYDWFDETQHLMRNGNWLMYSRSKVHVYVLDAKKHTKHMIICSIGIAFRPEGRYIETFVSPNQYLK